MDLARLDMAGVVFNRFKCARKAHKGRPRIVQENQTMISDQTSASNRNGGFTSASASDPVNRIAQSAHEAVDRVAAKASPAVDRLRESAAQMNDQFRQKVDAFSTWEERMAESARGYVRVHPFSTVAAAFLGGVVLAFLCRSSSRER
jgi:ElaB/YqjD/DUF883 family membrane-anchored ribosome-binding protein